MQGATKKAIAPKGCGVLVGIPVDPFRERLAQDVERFVPHAVVSFASTLVSLRQMANRERPSVILLDDRLLEPGPLAASLAEFAPAPVILVASYDRQAEVARLIADGRVEFVPRSGAWLPLAASLIERRLRWTETSNGSIVTPSGRTDIGELFRHEINNPLTGILGNAELILAHSDHLPAIDTQRIRTVVELAVRLRETVRRVSNDWEA